MNKLQKYLQQEGMKFKKDNGMAPNSNVFVELLKDGNKLDEYLGSAHHIYCRDAGKIADSIALYRTWDLGRNGWGPDRTTKRIISFPIDLVPKTC